MTQNPAQGPVVQIKPQPNIYTMLIYIAILALAVAIGVGLYALMAEPPAGYGMTIGDLFAPLKELIPGK